MITIVLPEYSVWFLNTACILWAIRSVLQMYLQHLNEKIRKLKDQHHDK